MGNGQQNCVGKLETLRSAAATFSPQCSIIANRENVSGKFSGWCEIKNEIFIFAPVFRFWIFLIFYFYFSLMQTIGGEKPCKYIFPYGGTLCCISCKYSLLTSVKMWLMLEFCSVVLAVVWIYALWEVYLELVLHFRETFSFSCILFIYILEVNKLHLWNFWYF